MSSQLSKKGSHGTCNTCAELIQKAGAFKTGYGLKGDGAYFWLESKYYEKLGLSWYKQRLEQKLYNHHTDKGPALFIAEIECDSSHVLDLLVDIEMRSLLAELVDKAVGMKKSISEISKGYDKAISIIEKSKNVKVKVILATVIGPEQEYCNYYNYLVHGSPACIIARDGSVIKNITRVSKEDIIKLQT